MKDFIDFDYDKGRNQKLPREKKLVMVVTYVKENLPPGMAVGYMRYAAGDKDSPVWTLPGVLFKKVISWCDCLPRGFEEAWLGEQKRVAKIMRGGEFERESQHNNY